MAEETVPMAVMIPPAMAACIAAGVVAVIVYFKSSMAREGGTTPSTTRRASLLRRVNFIWSTLRAIDCRSNKQSPVACSHPLSMRDTRISGPDSLER